MLTRMKTLYYTSICLFTIPCMLSSASLSDEKLISVPIYDAEDIWTFQDEMEIGRRRLQKDINSNSIVGTQFVEVFVGNPAIVRTMVVSTKSDFLAFPCAGCSDCGARTELFDYTKSVNFIPMPCNQCHPPPNPSRTYTSVCDTSTQMCAIADEFLEKGSWSGFEAVDWGYIGGAPIDYDPVGTDVAAKYGFPFTFACQTSVKGWFVTNYRDGILGMSDANTSFINQMFDAGKLSQRMFSLCFGHSHGAEKTAGALTLGGSDPKYHDTPTVYAQNTKTGGESYTVFLKKIWLRAEGGESVRPPRDGMKIIPVDFDVSKANDVKAVVMDSSMPYTSLNMAIDEGFRVAWKRITGQDYTYGRARLLEGDLERLPTVLLQFQADINADRSIDPNTVPGMVGDLDPTSPYDVIFAIPATHYMEYNANSGFYRTRLTFTSPEGSVIGANAMQGHDVAFDLGNTRVGFAESHLCKPKEGTFSNQVDDDLFASPIDIIAGSGHDEHEENGDIYSFPFFGEDEAADIVLEEGDLDEDERFQWRNKPGADPRFGPEADVMGIGDCSSVLCKAFLTIGYTGAMVIIFVLYKCSRMRKNERYRVENYDSEFFAEEEDEAAPSSFHPSGIDESQMLDGLVDQYNRSVYDNMPYEQQMQTFSGYDDEMHEH